MCIPYVFGRFQGNFSICEITFYLTSNLTSYLKTNFNDDNIFMATK